MFNCAFQPIWRRWLQIRIGRRQSAGRPRGCFQLWLETLEDRTAPALITDPNAVFSTPVVVFGTKEQCARMLPPIIDGRDKSCFAVTEPNTGLNTTQLKIRAVRQGDKYVVNGQKVWISTAHSVALITLGNSARMPSPAVSMMRPP